MVEYGVFCEMYGKTKRNLILEFVLASHYGDFAVGDLAEEIEISRPKAYQEVYGLEADGFIVKSRVVSGTQLYKLNKDNPLARKLLKDFNYCLKLVLEEYHPPRPKKKVKVLA